MSSPLHKQYDALWHQAQAAFSAGEPDIDPYLADKANDRRRSATLLLRPGAAVAARVVEVLGRLQLREPDQYYYRPQELHVTVLSLFTGTDQPAPLLAQLPRYRTAIDKALRDSHGFSIQFIGLTASPAAVMVQGFPQGRQLQSLREELRAAIQAVGLGHTLDQRYRITTAHMTAMRFASPLMDLARLSKELHSLRHYDFGTTQVTDVQLVENDWYMSADRVRELATYRLG